MNISTELMDDIRKWDEDWKEVQRTIDRTKEIPEDLPKNAEEFEVFLNEKYKITRR